MPGLPSVIVLGVDTPIGLTLVRELGRHGVAVHGIGSSNRALGRFSRYAASYTIRPRDRDALEQWLPALAHRLGSQHVMAVSEPDLLRLHRARDALRPLSLLIPPAEALGVVLDKRRTLERASMLGIEVPKSYDGAGLRAGHVAAPRHFPVVLKWGDPNQVAAALAAAGLQSIKAEYCLTPTDLEAALARYDGIARYPLVQEYIAGYGLGQMLLMHEGSAVLRFQHRRLHEWPPEGGVSTWCEAVPVSEHEALMEKSITLLRSIGWQGPAMVEYRFDPATRRAVLMEVNGRFWGSLPLASRSGAEFAWAHYASEVLGKLPAQAAVRFGLRARFMIPEVRRLGRVLFQPSRISDPTFKANRFREVVDFLAAFLDPRTRYYVFTPLDPRPALADMGFAACEAVKLLARPFRR